MVYLSLRADAVSNPIRYNKHREALMGKLIGNLITGDHVVPKPAMPLAKKLQIATAIFVVVSLGSFLVLEIHQRP